MDRLRSGEFLKEAINLLFFGRPGMRKTNGGCFPMLPRLDACQNECHHGLKRILNWVTFLGTATMSAVSKGLSLSQYLEYESKTGEKHEYYRGEIFAMVGSTPQHALIATNFLGEARQRLENKPCVAYTGDLRIKVNSSGLFTYPDASIICGDLILDEEVPNTVLNPTVLVEVLSESTEKYDRGQKSAYYRSIPSLQALVLISQNRPLVECFTRHETGGWLLTEARQLSESLVLEPIGISIPLSELYRNVHFDSAEA